MQRRRATGRPSVLVIAAAALLGLFVMHGLGMGHGPGHVGAPVVGHAVGHAVGPIKGHVGDGMAGTQLSHPPALSVVAAGLAPLDGQGSLRLAEMCLAVLPVLMLSLLGAAAVAGRSRTATASRPHAQANQLGGGRPATRHTPLYQLCVLRT